MMYTLKVGFTILNNLILDRGSDCNCIINGRVELLVEYILRRLLSKILFFIPIVTVRNVSNNNQSRLTTYWSNIQTTLEIIIDLPFGFPINNIISLNHVGRRTQGHEM